MDRSLESLERRKENIISQMRTLGDMRWGSISETYRKCGKPNCACARKGHPGHSQYLWTIRKQGKTVARVLHLGPELDQVHKQVKEGARFQKLCDDLWDVSEEICRLRPVPKMEDKKERSDPKKKLRRRFFSKRRKRSGI